MRVLQAAFQYLGVFVGIPNRAFPAGSQLRTFTCEIKRMKRFGGSHDDGSEEDQFVEQWDD